jgi:hypothetical protein
MQRVLLLLVVVAFIPRAAAAQGDPLGPEFRVNTYTTALQAIPRVAADPSGSSFVVVWPSGGQDGSSYGVFGQRFDAGSGMPLGAEFRVNTHTTGIQRGPAVAADASGNFVVVWASDGQDGSGYGVFGQRYASSGAPQGPEFRVNTYTTIAQRNPWVAADSAGNFVVVWHSAQQDGSTYGVFGQRFANSGVPQGLEFRVNTHTTGSQDQAAVTSDASGNFVVVWTSFAQDGSGRGIFGQRFASSGAALGPEFQVNTYTTLDQVYPSVAADASGSFVIVWGSVGQDGSGAGVFAQRYAASGAPAGPEFRVNTHTTGVQRAFSVATDAAANFVVVWDDDSSHDGEGLGIFGQRFASSGSPLGPEFQINTYTTGDQGAPTVASDGTGRFVVVWSSLLQDGSNYGVFGQRYSQIVPVELMHFGVE